MGAGPAGRGRYAPDAAPTCGQLLQRHRLLAGLTQEELAARAGYSANYIGKLEQDQRELPTAAADRLAAVLGLSGQDRAGLRDARERGRGGVLADRVLAGRESEMAQIRAHLAGGGPPVLLLAGEPGMGKTRLLEEAASAATGGGWGVARGGCLRRAQDPYAPLSGALADALARLPTGDRAEALRHVGQVDLLLPELTPPGAAPGDSGGGHAGIPEEQQRRLLAVAAGRLLDAAAGPAGTLLVLDDLHWADPDAIGLLAALVTATGSPPLRVIGAYRDSEAPAWLDEFTADLARESLAGVLPVPPLTDFEAGRLLRQLAPQGEQEAGVLQAILRRAGGVPFFLVAYAEQVQDAQGGTSLTVPWTVAQVIGQRVAALPGPARELLSTAAVAGRVVPHRLLAQVSRRPEEELVQAVEAVLAARLLAENEPAGYRFTHDLIRETIEDGLSAARRRLLHRRIGQALERDPGARAESLAFHFGKSDDDRKAITYLELAGDQAQQQVAYAAAAEFYAAAVTRLEAAGRGAGVVPVTEKQGMALYRAGRYDAAIAALEGALAGYRAAGDTESESRVTGRLAGAHYRAGTTPDALGPLADLANADQAPAPPAGAASPGDLTQWEGQLLLLYAQGSYEKMMTLGRSLAQAGRTAGNREMQAIGTRVHGAGLICQGRLADGAALMATALPADDAQAADIATLLSGAYLAMGSMDRSEELSEQMLAKAKRVGDQVLAALHTMMIAGACYVRGDWHRGRDLIGRAQEHSAASSSPVAMRAVAILAPVLIWEGAWQQARAYLDGCLQAARSLQIVLVERAALAYLAELDLLDGRPQDALIRLHPVTADHPAPATEDLTWGYAVHLLSVLAAAHLETGNLDHARAYAGRAVAEARRMGTWVQAIRALEVQGLVQARDGHHDLARAAYQEGMHRAGAMPYPYGRARLLHACGLLDRQQADEASAQAKFTDALAILETLGADRDVDKLRRAMAHPPPGSNPPDRDPA